MAEVQMVRFLCQTDNNIFDGKQREARYFSNQAIVEDPSAKNWDLKLVGYKFYDQLRWDKHTIEKNFATEVIWQIEHLL